MQIQQANNEHIPAIEALYAEAIAFQRSAGHPYWRNLDLHVVEADIAAGTQFLLMDGEQVAGIFSFCPPSVLDDDLWRGREPPAARYIHRIIVARAMRGRRLLAPILGWCEVEVARAGLRRLRLDTWADNPPLLAYYASFGFVLVGESTTSADSRLPAQYRGLRLAIMEKTVGGSPSSREPRQTKTPPR